MEAAARGQPGVSRPRSGRNSYAYGGRCARYGGSATSQETILDPADGKIYKAELWAEDGKLKVRGYLRVFYKTQTWLKDNWARGAMKGSAARA
jgi:hypothetical protein